MRASSFINYKKTLSLISKHFLASDHRLKACSNTICAP